MSEQTTRDLAAKPLPFLVAWGAPIAVLIATNFIPEATPFAATVLAITGALAWMGVGCALNARRCGRRHCFYSAPILLIGAAATALIGFGVVPLGLEWLNYAVWGALGLSLLTFVPEMIWGKYVARRV